jgi:hypothetical protein
MYRTLGLSVLGAAAFIGLSGCQQGTLFGEGSLFGDNRANIAGAASVVDTAVIEPISVGELVTTINVAASSPTPAPVTLDDAIVNYERSQLSPPPNNGPWANLRNTLQDRILVASQSRCGFYEEYLKRFQSNSATLFGSLATILGGAGAIVTGADGARALAGAAGISSGIGAEMQKDLFSGVTSAVIVPGIEKRRADILTSIIQNRCQTPDRYTIGLAIAQALQFHAACSMDVGLAEGGQAIKNATNPGAQGMASFISLGAQVNGAQSVGVSITKNRKGGAAAPSGATITTSITADSPADVSALLKSITDMTISPCPSTTGQPAVNNGAGGGAKPQAKAAAPSKAKGTNTATATKPTPSPVSVPPATSAKPG